MYLTQRVAQLYAEKHSNRALTGSVTMVEQGGVLSVRGPYGEIAPLIPKLKAQKFTYNPADKSWRIPADKLSPRQRQNTEKFIAEANGTATSKAEEVAKNRAELRAQLQLLLDEIPTLKLVQLKLTVKGDNLEVTGYTYPVKDEVKAAGGRWTGSEFVVPLNGTTPEKLRRLWTQLEQHSRELGARVQEVRELLPRSFPHLRVDVDLKTPWTLRVKGDTKPVKDTLRRHVDALRFEGSTWEVSVVRTNTKEVRALLDALEELDQAPPPVEQVPVRVPDDKTQKRTNQRPDRCSKCGGLVGVGEGWLEQHWEVDTDEERPYTWYTVQHKDPHDCEAALVVQRVLLEKARTKDQARRNLYDLVAPQYHVAGRHQPQGEVIWIKDRDSLAYGGGTWVVIEPDQRHFWYVKNNGHDGDDWSYNNVSTGGAGAIGWRIPLTDEIRVLIEAARE